MTAQGTTSVFVLLGPPGSGKGTQAARLNEKHSDWLHVSTGNLFRAEIASGSELGNSVKSILADGNLVSDEVTNQVFRSQVLKLLDEENPRAIILDGYPRTGPQSGDLLRFVADEPRLAQPVPVELKVSEAEVIDRLVGRLVNPRTGKIYHVKTNPPKVEGICDEDGGELIHRPDDQPEVIKSRYNLYVEQRESILSGLGVNSGSSEGRGLVEVDGVGEPSSILENLEQSLLGSVSDS